MGSRDPPGHEKTKKTIVGLFKIKVLVNRAEDDKGRSFGEHFGSFLDPFWEHLGAKVRKRAAQRSPPKKRRKKLMLVGLGVNGPGGVP